MQRFLDRISFAILAAIYLAATSGTLIGQNHHPARQHGRLTVSESGQTDCFHGKRLITSRRHLPMVRDIPFFDGILPVRGTTCDRKAGRVCPCFTASMGLQSRFPSTLADRAPPRS
jgi:hypothetical protein